MALFKISKGNSADINTTIPNTVEGYCYFNLYDNKFYIDTETGQANTDNRRVLFAGGLISPNYSFNNEGTSLIKFANGLPEFSTATVGSVITPVYLHEGTIEMCEVFFAQTLNESHAEVPTSLAVKTYVDGKMVANTTSAIIRQWVG